MKLYKLIYCSRNCDPASVDIDDILRHSTQNNALLNVTGILLFNAGCFLQVLEGCRSSVSQTYNRIARDPRHDEVTLISAGPVVARDFAEWHMKYVPWTGVEGALLRKYSSSKDFAPEHMSLDSIDRFLSEIRQISQPQTGGLHAVSSPASAIPA